MAHELPERCCRLLRLQQGIIASRQAEQAGLSARRMEVLVRTGRWQRVGFGVYAAFTGGLSRDAQLWAAVLRAGKPALLSYQTAAELNGLIDKPSRLIHVTIPASRHVGSINGVVIHRSARALEARDGHLLPPRTMIEETVLDLAQLATSFDDVVSLLARSCQRQLTSPVLLTMSMEMRPKMRWRKEIGMALRDVAHGVHSPLEYRYLRDVERAHGLPDSDRQAAAWQGRVVRRDVLYRRYRMVVELDGAASHPDEQRWKDKWRDNAAAADGLITLRYGWADVTERPCRTAREVAAVLHSRGWPGPLRTCHRCREQLS
jgi:very-short-patch-repair endonuclease